MKRTQKKSMSIILAFTLLFGSLAFGFSDVNFTDFAVKAEAATSGKCGDNLTWTLDIETGELIISGTGDMEDWGGWSDVPWCDVRSSIKSVTIGNSVTSIGDYAFYECTRFTSVTIGNNVTSIGKGAFWDCISLTSITIPNSVTSIGYVAFATCESLTSITIPDSVTSIGYGAFVVCESLTSITVDSNNKYYLNDEYGVLFNKNKTELIQYPAGNTRTSYTIPDSVTSIGEGAFCDCYSLTSVTIPDSVTSIGESAFCACDSLTSIKIPDSVTSIGDEAFWWCTSLATTYYAGTFEQWKKIKIGVNNSELTQNVVYECDFNRPHNLFGVCGDNLTYKLYDDGELEIVGTGEMYNWSKSTDVPWNGKYSNIKKLSIIGDVKSIGDYAFYFLYNLKEVTLSKEITSIGKSAFEYTGYYYDSKNWENEVLYIDNYLISAKNTISDLYKINCDTTVVAEKAFYSCSNLKKIVIPSSMTNIGESAFEGCVGLTDVYYVGSEADWNKIIIDSNNSLFINAIIHFNYKDGDENDVMTQPEVTTTVSEITSVPVTEEETTKSVEESTTIPVATEPPTTKPVEIPTTTKPAVTESSTTKPAETTEPTTSEPIDITTTTKPAVTEPSTTKPVETSTTTKPVETTKPATTKPVETTKPTTVPTTKPIEEPTTAPTTKPVETTKPTTTAPTTKPVETTKPSTTIPTTKPVIEEEIIKKPSTSEVKYGETLILHADFANVPDGAKIEWSVDGEGVTIAPSADGKTCAVTSTATGDVTITAKYVDANGVEHISEQGIESNASFWNKIVSFFKNLFGMNRIIEQAIKF